jgi:hypothetical protein
MGKKKRGNYNQDHFKVGGSLQPGGDLVQEQQKQRVSQQKPRPPKTAKADEPAIPEDAE